MSYLKEPVNPAQTPSTGGDSNPIQYPEGRARCPPSWEEVKGGARPRGMTHKPAVLVVPLL